jgi:hypothetical protein
MSAAGLRAGRVDDLQTWLALENEAVWLYGMIGARVRDLDQAARTSYDAHRVARDRLRALVHDAGGQPVSPALTYGKNLIDSPGEARAAASDVEHRIAAACVTLVGDAGATRRTFALAGLRRAALAGLDWGAKPQAFPGLD